MSAHEFMNMARVRAEQAEARADRAEAALGELRELLRGVPSCVVSSGDYRPRGSYPVRDPFNLGQSHLADRALGVLDEHGFGVIS